MVTVLVVEIKIETRQDEQLPDRTTVEDWTRAMLTDDSPTDPWAVTGVEVFGTRRDYDVLRRGIAMSTSRGARSW